MPDTALAEPETKVQENQGKNPIRRKTALQDILEATAKIGALLSDLPQRKTLVVRCLETHQKRVLGRGMESDEIEDVLEELAGVQRSMIDWLRRSGRDQIGISFSIESVAFD